MHDPGNNNCPRNADPRNESCSCDVDRAQDRKERAAACWEVLDRLKPAGAQALIVAELRQDDSDSMTDYFASHTTRTVAIGWRTGSREDFRQLRKAAALFEATENYRPGSDRWQVWAKDETGESRGTPLIEGETLHIHGTEEQARERVEAVRAKLRAEWAEQRAMGMIEHNLMEHGYTLEKHSIEHRENWSMGAGNYLGDSKYSGWIVRSRELKYAGYRNDVFETDYLEVIMQKPEPKEFTSPSGWTNRPLVQGGTTISENEEKDGIEIRFAEKPAAEILTRLKANGWRWSRFSSCWYAKRSEGARAFAEQVMAGGVA